MEDAIRDVAPNHHENECSAPVGRSIGQRYAASIEQIYRRAVAADSSPRSQIAYACFLADHGRFFESIREFEELMNDTQIAEDSAMLAEIVHHISKIQYWLADDEAIDAARFHCCDDHDDFSCDDDEQENWDYQEAAGEFAKVVRQLKGDSIDVSAMLARLNRPMLDEVGDLLSLLRNHRTSNQRRNLGLTFLKLALFCGRQNWCALEVDCIRKAIHCFEEAATAIRHRRQEFLSERAAISTSSP